MSKYKDILVVDLESTCWAYRDYNQRTEIIEIGVALLNLKTLSVLRETHSYFVKPIFGDRHLSTFCKDLTHITDYTLQQYGHPFKEVCATLAKEYGTKNRPWASWGDWDRTMMKSQCLLFEVDNPMSETHINIKHIYSLMTGRRRGLAKAYGEIFKDKPYPGHHHSGQADAKAGAYLLAHMIGRLRNGGQEEA